MHPVQVEEDIRKIKEGDRLLREDFLDNNKAFIHKIACKFSRRYLEWGRDDELAVALVAFNEAIDRFRADTGVPFPAYARIVIMSRLTDHRRRENRNTSVEVPLPQQGEESNSAEFSKAWEVYLLETAARERAEEIREYEGLLREYGVSFEDLVKCSPRHRDTRRSLIFAAAELTKRENLLKEFRAKKKLPLMELENCTGISRKTLERGRKYIIAISLLISRQNDFLHLSSYLKLPVEG
ncbi:sigma-70 family RNA polymerase sigma factor [Pelotomaculum propionicicum]|uniref:RNA polymerase sigma factor SigI n=1 Tax=Pelotomaculum propionicicum TaxID=258475 RepID=A0A4Y7RSZ7_9FIRM|nr:sigma-70 family RNA polymerase sigma factor [Pelotomaculum propionicicum]NLI14179.1 sigma-70 family RNA polymerase sigma factor [Peptococcaceae bacterium]TEB12013.1 RNA polymerase sigma factor SigI [Pelotomaculum propionicicum]